MPRQSGPTLFDYLESESGTVAPTADASRPSVEDPRPEPPTEATPASPSRKVARRLLHEEIVARGKGELSDKEIARLERREQTRRNRRGRRNPAVMPDRLARTSAFAPRRRSLSSDSNFIRTYEVPGYSVVTVRGRELGSQHRDGIYALFRFKREIISVPNPDYRPGRLVPKTTTICETRTTWRGLLRTMGRTEHVNNLLSLLHVFQEIQQVTVIIFEGRSLEDLHNIQGARGRNMLPDVPGSSSALITELNWDGATLDSEVVVRFGTHVVNMIERAHLISVNGDVHFRLKSDHARSFWPFLDSQPEFTWIDEGKLAQVAGFNLWGEGSTAVLRGQFRKDCRQAFNDMVAAGGLKSWSEEIIHDAGRKTRRYHYVHALPRRIDEGADDAVDADIFGIGHLQDDSPSEP